MRLSRDLKVALGIISGPAEPLFGPPSHGGWKAYTTTAGHRGDYPTIATARDAELVGFIDALIQKRLDNPDYYVSAAELRPQPFLRIDLTGSRLTTESFGLPRKGGCILFITPSLEPADVDVIPLWHLDGETVYLVRADVAGSYFGNDSAA
jgi:hypothetical protein